MNCLIVDDEEVSRLIVRELITRTEGLHIVGECSTALDALKMLKQEQIDILFLDIEMPNMNGIELVQVLDDMPQIILITGRRDFAAEAFDCNVTDYLVKPVNYSRFLKAVEKARQQSAQEKGEEELGQLGQDLFFIKTDNKITKLRLQDVHFIEALADYVIIHTEQRKHVIHATMKGLESRLPSSDFVRVHRSFIVNIHKVETIEDMQINIANKVLPIGNSYKMQFMSRLNFL